MVTRSVPAWPLQVGWNVIPDHGSPRRVTSQRPEGAPPTVVVEYAGLYDRITYPANQQLAIKGLHDHRADSRTAAEVGFGSHPDEAGVEVLILALGGRFARAGNP